MVITKLYRALFLALLLLQEISSLKVRSNKLQTLAQQKKESKVVLYASNGPLGAALKIAGPIIFTGMQISAVQTALKINADKSIGKLSGLPFVSLLTNCIVWSLYGLLKKDKTVLIPNTSGIFAGIICTIIYHKYAPSPPVKLYGLAAIIVAFVLKCATRNDFTTIGLVSAKIVVTHLCKTLAM